MPKLETRTDGTYLRFAPCDFAPRKTLPQFLKDWIAEGFQISTTVLPVNEAGGYVHPTAQIKPGVTVHPSAIVGAEAQVGVNLPEGVIIGDYVRTGECAGIGAGTIIGIGTQLKIWQKIGAGVLIGPDNILEENLAANDPWETIINDQVLIGARNLLTAIDVIGRAAVLGAQNEIIGTTQEAGLHLGYKAVLGDHCYGQGQIYIGNGSAVGSRCYLGSGVVLKSDARVGNNVHVGEKTILDGALTVHNNVKIGADCFIGAGTTLEEEVELEANSGVERQCTVGTKALIKAGVLINVGRTVKPREIINLPDPAEKAMG